MTLKQLYEEKYPKIPYIAIYEGEGVKIYADFADEYLETHGHYEVEDSYYSEKKKTLIVELKK